MTWLYVALSLYLFMALLVALIVRKPYNQEDQRVPWLLTARISLLWLPYFCYGIYAIWADNGED